MPLLKSVTPKARAENIRREVSAGKPPRQVAEPGGVPETEPNFYESTRSHHADRTLHQVSATGTKRKPRFTFEALAAVFK